MTIDPEQDPPTSTTVVELLLREYRELVRRTNVSMHIFDHDGVKAMQAALKEELALQLKLR